MRTAEAHLVLAGAEPATPREVVLMAAAYEGEDALWDRRLKRAIAAAMLKLPGGHNPVVIAAACQATILWELDAQPASRMGKRTLPPPPAASPKRHGWARIPGRCTRWPPNSKHLTCAKEES